MAFRWWIDGGPLIVVLRSSLPSQTKKIVKYGPPSEKTFWIRACIRPSFIQVDHYKMLTGPTGFSGSAQEIHLKICKLKTSPIHFEYMYQIQLLKEPIRKGQ